MRKLIVIIFLLSAPILAQNTRYDAPFPSISSTSSTPYLVANIPPNSPTLAVCNSPANQVPCTNYATTYNSTGAACPNGAQDTPQPQPSACQSTGDAQGNIGFWAPAGTYDYTVCVRNNCYGPYTVTIGGPGGSSAAFETNGVSNPIQTLLNLISGTNITLTADGTGGVTIDAAGGGGGGTPGGSVTQLQFNDGGFGGSSSATYNKNLVPGEVDPQNVNNVMFVTTAWNWSQLPAGTLTAGVPATVTLAPCPAGIDGRDNIGVIGVTGVGTPEPVKMTGGGSCRPGNASGTINFTPASSHSAGYTIGSASSGIYEAIAAYKNWTGTGGSAQASINLKPAGAPVANGNITYAYAVMGRIIPPVNGLTINGNGALLACTTRDACISIESSLGTSVTIRDLRFASNLDINGWAISQTECSANTTTIHTTLAHGIIVGDMVDVQRTDDGHYWGGSTSEVQRVSAVGANTVSWTDTNCSTGVVGGTRALANTPGYINILNASIYTTEQTTTLENLSFAIPGGSALLFTGHFNNHVVVLNDQSFRWIGSTGVGLRKADSTGACTTGTPYCGAVAYFPGSFTTGPSVAWLKNMDFSVNCTGNGLVAYNGNTLDWEGGISQAQAQVALSTGSKRGGFGNSTFTDAYIESGACTNPDTGAASSAGVLNYGNHVKWSGGEGPQGIIPTFVTGGATTYYYYLMANDGSGNNSAPLFFGSARPTTNTFDIYWPRVQPATSANPIVYTNPTYTVIRTTDNNFVPYTAGCAGGSTSACGSVTVAAAQCAGLMCHFTDDITVNTTAVTIPDLPTYEPPVSFWPGPIVLAGGSTLNYDTDSLIGTVTTLDGKSAPSVFSYANEGGVMKHSWSQAIGGPVALLDEPATGGATYLNSKGRINLNRQLGHTVPISSILTLVDSSPTKTLASSSNRPVMDATDVWIGNDVTNAPLTAAALAFGSPVSVSNYINLVPDGISWLERLTATKKEFAVATQFDQPMTAALPCTGCGAFERTTAITSDTLNRAPGAIGANWTLIEGTWQITSGAAFAGKNYAYFDTVVVDGAASRAGAYYSAVAFTTDQFAQANITAANSIIGVCVRMNAAPPLQGYCLISGSNLFDILKINGGVTTILAAGAPNVANNSIIKISAIGSTITGYLNGVQVYQVTDTALPTGNPGIYGQTTITTAHGLSNFYADSAGWTASEGLTFSSLAPTTLADAATITWNVLGYSGKNATVTLGGNRTLNVTNLANGGNYVLRIVQDATPPRTLTLGTGCTWKVVNGGAGAITLTNAANAIDILTFYYDGTNCYANLGANYN